MSSSIIELVAKSSAVIAVAAIAAGLLQRRGSAASRHLVWTLAVVGLIVLPVAAVVLPSWNIPIRRELPSLSVAGAAAEIAVEPTPAVHRTPLSEPVQGTAPSALSWIAILPIAYAAGVLLLLGRLSVEHWRTRRILSRSSAVTDVEWTRLLGDCIARTGTRRAVRLARSREEVMPMTSGTRRPAILIPSLADLWDDGRRRAVILHELAHVVRFDCLTQTLAEAAVALYWPHPGVWWVARRLRVERELACDDCVLESGTEPREYAGHLLEIAHSVGHYRAPALAVGMARPRQLEGRMMAMLDPTRNRAMLATRRRLLALAVAVVVVAPLGAATLVTVPVATDVTGVPSPRAASTAGSQALALAQNAPTTAVAGGTWQIRLAADGRSAHLTVSVAPGSSYGTTIPLDRVEGLRAILTGPGGPARYTLKRDAGTFDFEGVVRAGAGGGTFSFTPNAAFADELVRRGFSRPTPFEVGVLAWSDIGFAFLDELNALKYERPTLQQLLKAAQHGVTSTYVREMADLGYRLGTIDALVELRNHGVDAGFVRGMAEQGMKGLSAEELVRSRNHGVDPQFIQGLRALGYQLNMDQFVEARNHGIDPEYVRQLRELGYQLRLDELVDARNHGVDPDFIREMAAAGYQHPSLADLVRMRNHGINAKTVERLKSRGFDHLSIDRLIELQSRGANADPATLEPSLRATRGIHQSIKVVVRDVAVAMQQWADRWLR